MEATDCIEVNPAIALGTWLIGGTRIMVGTIVCKVSGTWAGGGRRRD